MKIQNINEIEETEVTMEGAKDAKMRLLISDKDGANNFAMRMFTVEPGGHTPFHFHNYEHEIYVLEGEGVLHGADGEHAFKSGDVIFVQPNEKHQFRNVGEKEMKFLCLIPTPEKCA
ncbi:cupin domain-containing protein [candidate division KSB1 bacterium]|nr:cupin domain-containing protein [candidate division KSB1 bacterium]